MFFRTLGLAVSGLLIPLSASADFCGLNPTLVGTKYVLSKSQTLSLTSSCVADFGSRGFETAAGAGIVVKGVDGNQTFDIRAGGMSLAGKILVKNANLSLTGYGDISLGAKAKIQIKSPTKYRSYLLVDSSGSFNNLGTELSVNSGGSAISIKAKSIHSHSEIVANGKDYITTVALLARAGDVVTEDAVSSVTKGTLGSSLLSIGAVGRVEAKSLTASGGVEMYSRDPFGGYDFPELVVDARGGDIKIHGNITAKGGKAPFANANDMQLTATGAVNILGSVYAMSFAKSGSTTAGGDVVILPGVGSDININGGINGYTSNAPLADHNSVLLGPACNIHVGGEIKLSPTSDAPTLDAGHC